MGLSVNGNEAYMPGKVCDTDFSRTAANLREFLLSADASNRLETCKLDMRS